MTTKTFDQLLLEGAFFAMACDAVIHPDEVATLKKMMNQSAYFDGTLKESDLKEISARLKEKGTNAIKDYFEELEESSLNAQEKQHLMEVLIRIIEADEVIENSEVDYIHKVIKILGLTNKELIIHFPTRVSLFMNLRQKENPQLKEGLEHTNFSGLYNSSLWSPIDK